jgi:hypothetical protein
LSQLGQIYGQEAVDAMIEVTKKLSVESPETTLLLNKVSGYVAGLEDLVVNYCSTPRPKDFLPLDWTKTANATIAFGMTQ